MILNTFYKGINLKSNNQVFELFSVTWLMQDEVAIEWNSPLIIQNVGEGHGR